MTLTPIHNDGGLHGTKTEAGVGAGAGTGAERRPADQEAAERFDQMMRGDGGVDTQPAETTSPQLPSGPFDLFGSGRSVTAAATTTTTAAASTGLDVNAIAGAVVERMLVSDGPGGGEVRLFLKEDVLPGVEVRIRQTEGRIAVEFVCTNADSQAFLDKQCGGLSSLLTERLGSDAEVTVRGEGDGDVSANSRASFDTGTGFGSPASLDNRAVQDGQRSSLSSLFSERPGGEDKVTVQGEDSSQPGDGRSRQHYVPQPEDEAAG